MALAEDLDARHYRGLPPYASYVARTVLFHSLAFNENLKGVSADELRWSMLGPALDPSFIDDARRRFQDQSAYLDDRPTVPMRFLTEANLTQIVRRQEQQVDPAEVRAQLNDRIRSVFGGRDLRLAPFPGSPLDVPDDGGEGHPQLAVIGYDAETVRADAVALPLLVERIFRYRSAAGTDFRRNVNDVVFLVADEALKDEMRHATVRRLALTDLQRPERQAELAEHQRDRVQEWWRRSEQEAALAIQQCYRHLFYPSKNRLDGASVDLAHTAIDLPSASDRPGAGQAQVVRVLAALNKLRREGDSPDSPAYIRDRTPLRKGQMTTRALREEFRRDPALPMLIGDGVFVAGVRLGVDHGEYVYQSGELVWGQGDPPAAIKIDEQSFVYTMACARERGIWPRRPPPREAPGEPAGAPAEAAGGVARTPGGASTARQPAPPSYAPELDQPSVSRIRWRRVAFASSSAFTPSSIPA